MADSVPHVARWLVAEAEDRADLSLDVIALADADLPAVYPEGPTLIMPGTLSILAAVFPRPNDPEPSPSGPGSPGRARPSASWAAAGSASTTGGVRCSS